MRASGPRTGSQIRVRQRLSKEFKRVTMRLFCPLDCCASRSRNITQDHGKGGMSSRGVAFMALMAVLTVLAVLESTLPWFCLSYKIQHNVATVAVLTVLAVLVVMAVSVMTAAPLKLNSLFRDPELLTHKNAEMLFFG